MINPCHINIGYKSQLEHTLLCSFCRALRAWSGWWLCTTLPGAQTETCPFNRATVSWSASTLMQSGAVAGSTAERASFPGPLSRAAQVGSLYSHYLEVASVYVPHSALMWWIVKITCASMLQILLVQLVWVIASYLSPSAGEQSNNQWGAAADSSKGRALYDFTSECDEELSFQVLLPFLCFLMNII